MTVHQAKVLVLYTGGTIGMMQTERGLTVAPGFLSVCSFQTLDRSRQGGRAIAESLVRIFVPRIFIGMAQLSEQLQRPKRIHSELHPPFSSFSINLTLLNLPPPPSGSSAPGRLPRPLTSSLQRLARINLQPLDPSRTRLGIGGDQEGYVDDGYGDAQG
jgi:hypothetical protein